MPYRQLNTSRIRVQKWHLDNSITFYADRTNLTDNLFPDELTPYTNYICRSSESDLGLDDESSDEDINYSANKRSSAPNTKYAY